MKVIQISEAKPYNPPLHHAMVALKLCDNALCDALQFWCGLSHFLPGGGAEWAYDDSPTEKLYVVLDGAITTGTLVACSLLSTRTISPLMQLTMVFSRWHAANVKTPWSIASRALSGHASAIQL